jgi:hypothetical protein
MMSAIPTMVEITGGASDGGAEAALPSPSDCAPVGRHHRSRWIRRTRIDGDSWDLLEVPLGEEGERYEVAILDGDEAAAQLRRDAAGWSYPRRSNWPISARLRPKSRL